MTVQMRKIAVAIYCLAALIASGNSFAQNNVTSPISRGDYLIHFSTFNSSFLTPDVASAYGFVRGPDKALVNIAVTKTQADDDHYGLPVDVSGRFRNLMQQQTLLEFVEIQEQNATYYIAPFEFDNEEVLHFDIEVLLPGQTRTTNVSFIKKLYDD